MRTRAGCLLVVVALVAGCEDLRQFSGTWVGGVSPDPVHQHGFGPEATVRATVANVTRSHLEMTLEVPGRPGAFRFESIRRAAQDALADLRLPAEPLRTYLGFVSPPGEPPFLAVVSLFAEDRIDVRLIRGSDEAYGVFTLCRGQPCASRRTTER
jgi:hypothetical protein